MFIKKIVRECIGNKLFSATWITAKNEYESKVSEKISNPNKVE